jgi:Ca-activated chloride channel family protein
VRLVGLCRAAAGVGVTTSTIGFGADYDETLLRAMADAGGGNTWYIERPDQAPGVFEEEIEGLLTIAAQNVTVTIRQGEDVQLVAVHNDYQSAAGADGIRVEMGDLYAREPKSLLVELFVPGLDEREAVRIAEVTVSAYALTEGGGVERREVRFPIMSSLAAQGREEPEVRREMLLLDAARAREEALHRRDLGDTRGASHVLDTVAARLSVAAMTYGEGVAEQAADLAALARKLEREEFSAADAKYAAQRAYNVRRGKMQYEEKLARGRRKP